MIIRQTFRLTSWRGWDHQIDRAVQAFRRRFTVCPNLLLANEATLARIDIAADDAKVQDEDGNAPPAGQLVALGSFVGETYEVDFCILANIPDQSFALVFDDDPDGDGEEVPEQDTPNPASRALA